MASSILSSIAALALLGALVVPVSLYFGWAASILWGWFVVPVFGLPPITVMQAWGITLALSMLRPKINMSKSESDFPSGLLAVVIAPPLSVGFGYAIKFWWM